MSTSSHEHIVKSFDTEMSRLTAEIADMAALAVQQLEAAMDALHQRDDRVAQRVADRDDGIDDQERRISREVLQLLALRQPMARDLREILAALRIASDVERIGDYATNIARRSMALNRSDPIPLAGSLAPMARAAAHLVRDAMQAYVTRDSEMAHVVWTRDAEVDALYNTLFRELLTFMMKDPHQIAAGTHLLFIAKNIERIGDHTTNIAENIWFAVRGEPLTESRTKPDRPSAI